jgi:hypothetical protein
MQKAIILQTSTREENKKKQLFDAITRKTSILKNLTTKIEMLRMELDLVKHEYDVRIGTLLLKDNQLDLEIIQAKNINTLMEQGMTLGEAQREISEYFYSDILRMQQEQEKIEAEQELYKDRKIIDENAQAEIKALWKALIRKFHPDLVMDPKEKIAREAIMKKINFAYSINDMKTLQGVYNALPIETSQKETIEFLEKRLVDIENTIIVSKKEYNVLQSSPWYGWKTKIDKAKKIGKDVFLDLEKTLLNDIVKKIETLKKIKKN